MVCTQNNEHYTLTDRSNIVPYLPYRYAPDLEVCALLRSTRAEYIC